MTRPRRFFRTLVVPLACMGLMQGCSRRRPATSPMELEHNLLSSGQVEVFAPPGASRTRAAKLLVELEANGEFEACLGEPAAESFEDDRSARLVFGTTSDEDILRLLEPLELEIAEGEGGFRFLDEEFRSPNDAVVLTREDPDRPGLPLTVYAANDEQTLQNWMQDLEPCSRPGVRIFSAGRPALALRCSVNGRPWLDTLFDYRSLRHEVVRPGAASAIPVGGGAAKIIIPPGFAEPERLEEYRAKLDRALRRVDSLLSDARKNRPPLRIYVFDHTADFQMAGGLAARTSKVAAAPVNGLPGALGGGLTLARTNPVGRTIDVLLAPGLPDDGGAATAVMRAHDRAGPVADSWLADGLGVHAAGTWWGRDLRDWTTHFVPRGSTRESVEALIHEAVSSTADRSLSAHVVLPLRALVLERVLEIWSKESGEVEDWTGLWIRGARDSVISTAVALVATELVQLAAAAPANQGPRQLTPPGTDLTLGWEFEEGGPSYGSREASRAFVAAGEAGVRRVELRSCLAVKPARLDFARFLRTYEFAPIEGDLALAGGLSAARRQNMQTSILPDLLLTPSGARFGERVRRKRGPGADEVWGETFEVYARFVQHYALLCELCDSDDFLIGSGVLDFSQSLGDISAWDDPLFEEWLRNGWKRVIQRARLAFDGRVGYRADWPSEAFRIEFWDQLDLCVLGLDDAFPHPKSPYRRPDDGQISGMYSNWIHNMRKFADERGLALSVTAYLPSSSEAWRNPSTLRGSEADSGEQERLAAALSWALRGLREKGNAPESIMIHGARTDPNAGGAEERDFTVQNKPALNVLRALVKGRAAKDGD